MRRKHKRLKPSRPLAETPAITVAELLRRRDWAEIIIVLLAVLAAYCLWLLSSRIPVVYDSAGFADMARHYLTQGILSKHHLSEIRTYGYPAIVSVIFATAGALGLNQRWTVFGVQLVVHLLAAFFVRSSLLRAGLPGWVARACLVGLALNPLALLATTYVLTESLSLSLIAVVFACAVRLPASDRPELIAAAGSLACGVLMVLRPVNLYIVPVWFIVAGAALYLRRMRPLRVAGVGVLGALLIVAPLLLQLRNNLVFFGKARPLIATDIQGSVLWYGIRYCKYATSYMAAAPPQIVYENPYYANEPLSIEKPLRWYAEHPLKGLGTVAIHVFNLFDQDLPFVYNATLNPGYYPTVTWLNWAVVALAGFGTIWLARIWTGQSERSRLTAATAVVLVLAHVAIQSLFHVEARFGWPSLLFIYPAAALTAVALWRGRRKWPIVFAVLVMVATASWGTSTSKWIRGYAPEIRREMELRELTDPARRP